MVAVVEDDGVIGEAEFFEFGEDVADLLVEGGDDVGVDGVVGADFGEVGEVGWEVDVFGCDACFGGDEAFFPVLFDAFGEEAGFVGDRLVEDGEEGLAFATIFVVGGGGAFVPVGGVVAFEVVVGFGVIGAVVAGFAEVGDVGFVVGGDGVAAAHVLGAHGGGVGAHEDGGAGDGADGGIGVEVGEADAFAGEFVEVWGMGLFVAIAAQPLEGVVLGGDPEDVGAVFGFSGGEADCR